MSDENIEAQLTRLKQEHRDLDDSITALRRAGTFDRLQLQRLKKKKLQLKDEISKLEGDKVPDIIA